MHPALGVSPAQGMSYSTSMLVLQANSTPGHKLCTDTGQLNLSVSFYAVVDVVRHFINVYACMADASHFAVQYEQA